MSLEERSLELLGAAVAELPGGGEHRPGQEQMTAAVAGAFASGRHLAVAAGTGTGKSLAYLVPAVLSDRRVVVATATKALQDQLAGKELPLLASLEAIRRLRPGRRPLRWAVLKGRANYACRQLVAEASRTGLQLSLDEGTTAAPAAPDDLRRLIAWAGSSITGDRADVDWDLPSGVWERLSVSAEQCPGRSRCPQGKVCFTEAARDRAEKADVVIVNSHLLVLHLLGMPTLPAHELVVIDEAHQFENTVTDLAGPSLTERRLRTASTEVNRAVPRAGAPLAEVGRRLTGVLDDLRGERLPTGGPPELQEVLTLTGTRLETADAELRTVREEAIDDDTKAQSLRAQGMVSALRDNVAGLLEPPAGTVTFVKDERGPPELRLAPLEVGELLRQTLFANPTVVMTSATLPASTPASLGLAHDDYRYLDVGSPFDYPAAGLLYVATRMPHRNAAGFPEAVVEELHALVTAARGRTLALFTSHRMLDHATEALSGRLNWPLLRQGDLPPPQLLARFAAQEESCLFATIGFWQGVDVPGPALTLVTLDKLPFPRPDDPLLAARREHAGEDAFTKIDLHHTAVMLAQGAGRLIRSAADRGVVAVLDSRLATARYRSTLLEELPPLRRTTDREEVLAFLAGL